MLSERCIECFCNSCKFEIATVSTIHSQTKYALEKAAKVLIVFVNFNIWVSQSQVQNTKISVFHEMFIVYVGKMTNVFIIFVNVFFLNL